MAAVQQAESLASRRRGAATEKRDEPAQNKKEVSVHQQPPPRGRKTTLILPVDNQRRHDVRRDIEENRRRRYGDAEERGYSTHRGRRYDSVAEPSELSGPPALIIVSKTSDRRARVPNDSGSLSGVLGKPESST